MIGYDIPGGGKYGNQYPDTILPETNRYIVYNMEKELSSGLEHHFPTWEKYFSLLPRDTLSIYIFHSDTLNKYPWNIVKEKYMILKRYDLSLSDLKQLDFKVPYPPSSAMSNMKMYPPYKEE